MQVTQLPRGTAQGDAYKAHTSCISEAEKYQGALYKGGKAAKKNPQERWTDAMNLAAEKAEGSLGKVFQTLIEFPNVPRKKTRFLNFARNSLRMHSEDVLNQLFDAICAEFGSTDGGAAGDTPAAGASGGSGEAAGGKKRPREESDAASAAASSGSKWQQLAVQVLQDAPKRTLTKKALRKAVAAAAGVDADDKKAKKGVKKALESMADFRLVATQDKNVTLL